MDTVVRARDALDRAIVAAMSTTVGEMKWGVDDCGLWCGNILREAMGYDPCSELRGRYRTRRGARRVLGAGGLPSALRRAARRHRWRRIEEGHEQPGDIGVLVVDGAAATMICRARGWFVGRSEHGWTALPSKHLRIIWSVL